MNRNKLKIYAPQARRDFIQAMTDHAAFFGLTSDKIEPAVERGDVAVIAGRDHPRAVAKKRKQLEDRIQRHGFEQTMEALAYTWFNRLVAIRFMELHGYLDHGYRVLSHPEGKPTPEILEHAEHVEFPGLKKETTIDLKLAGNKENELYRLLLTAQCNALHTAMPFLFERIGDDTELLLPDNLLHSDSLIRKLVSEIDEEDWQEVEIIGWIYQFYISEKKGAVIGKVVASEDIPAATQLFTPNWIVKYLVQNSLGRQWLATYPESSLREQMQYYIEPAQQTSEVQEQLNAITPTSLKPEDLTLLDPACGSGHILVEAYDLFKAIYQERGYRAKDIPALILHNNLFGLEIDDRAAQLAAFALMMKARADDRRIFDSEAKPNVLAFQDSQGMNAAQITYALNSPINKEDVPAEHLFEEMDEEKAGLFSKKALAEKGHVFQGDIASLLELFENAKTFGSLIQVPPKLAAMLSGIEKRLDEVLKHGDLTHASAHVLKPLLQQARFLARLYDAVVANPPYMGTNYMNALLKRFSKQNFPKTKLDTYTMFIERGFKMLKPSGLNAMVTMQSWMFLSSYEEMRKQLLDEHSLVGMVHMGNTVMGIAFGTAATVWWKPHYRNLSGRFSYVSVSDLGEDGRPTTFPIENARLATVITDEFLRIPGSPIIYWASERVRSLFHHFPQLGNVIETREGLTTADNTRFLRFWHEVPWDSIAFEIRSNPEAAVSCKKWFPYLKGGEYRKWYGNHELVVNWFNDGEEVKKITDPVTGRIRSHNYNGSYAFREGISWSGFSNNVISVRYVEGGFMFDAKGPMAFASERLVLMQALALLNSNLGMHLMLMLAPTADFKLGHVLNLPHDPARLSASTAQIGRMAAHCIAIAKRDWDSSEVSWDFAAHPLLGVGKEDSLGKASKTWERRCLEAIRILIGTEEELGRVFSSAYGLDEEVAPEVPPNRIALSSPDACSTIEGLISYATGCMMGRYSLDKLGLIYANNGNQGFEPTKYKTFRADDDGIIPLLETDWGIRDDVANRIEEFIGVAWPKEHLEENLKFIADSLGPTSNEQPRDTIRRYLATGFYKHHLSMYKKRPIYWLFCSGRQRAFQCLVYLHRYTEGTLARMRTEYVIPLQGQIAGRIEQLEGDKAEATSTSHRKKLQKEQDELKKQQAELLTFEEKLKHAADQKISLDLDDGVKVNYGKFGDLLAEAKAITGGKDDE